MKPPPHKSVQPDNEKYYDKDWYDEFREQIVQELLDVTAKKNNDYTTGTTNTNPFANFDQAKTSECNPLLVCALGCRISFREP